VRAALGQLCAVEADNATDGALAHIDELAAHFPNSAESCRARYYLASGRVKECDEAQRACERFALQLGGLQETRVSEMASYATTYSSSRKP
jgi:hypothetical protein